MFIRTFLQEVIGFIKASGTCKSLKFEKIQNLVKACFCIRIYKVFGFLW